jgi:hypothetical protein
MKTVISADQLETKDIGKVVEALISRASLQRTFQRGVYSGKDGSSIQLVISEGDNFYKLSIPYGESGFLATGQNTQISRPLSGEDSSKYFTLLSRFRPIRVQKANGYCGGRRD